MNIGHRAHRGFVTLVNHQTLIPGKTDAMGLLTFMKENKRFWLLPVSNVVLLVGGLVVWGEFSPAPFRASGPRT